MAYGYVERRIDDFQQSGRNVAMFLFFRRRSPQAAVARDADHLMMAYGEGAYKMAGAMSWREDTGLLHQEQQGHWHRVQLEIGRRVKSTGADRASAELEPSLT